MLLPSSNSPSIFFLEGGGIVVKRFSCLFLGVKRRPKSSSESRHRIDAILVAAFAILSIQPAGKALKVDS